MIQLLDFTFVRQKDFHNVMPFFWITLNGLNSQESVSSVHDGVTFCVWASVSTSEFDSNATGYMFPVDPTGKISVSMCMGSIYIINYFVPHDT